MTEQIKPSGCAFTEQPLIVMNADILRAESARDFLSGEFVYVQSMGEHELLNWQIGKVKDKLVALDFTISGDTVFRFEKGDITIDADFGLSDICIYITLNNELDGSKFFYYKRHSWDTDLIKYVAEKINEYSR